MKYDCGTTDAGAATSIEAVLTKRCTTVKIAQGQYYVFDIPVVHITDFRDFIKQKILPITYLLCDIGFEGLISKDKFDAMINYLTRIGAAPDRPYIWKTNDGQLEIFALRPSQVNSEVAVSPAPRFRDCRSADEAERLLEMFVSLAQFF